MRAKQPKSKLTAHQRQRLKLWVKVGPLKAGYECACWSALMVQDLIARRFGIYYYPHYVSTLLRNLGFSFQKSRSSTHLRHFKQFEDLVRQVDEELLYFSQTSSEITALMGKYCKTLGSEVA